MHDNTSIKEQVRERYAEEARRVRQNSDQPSCCGGAPAVSKSKPSCCGSNASAGDPITSNLYLDDEKAGLPADAVAASLGCGLGPAVGPRITVEAPARTGSRSLSS